jgi:nitroimidazol reductase NimA-like FMN-containing flavoprotein (pyridoxamine 5'-phosphate oxidase superfamily)
MMGELDTAQIDEVLRSEVLGRIGCIADGWPYIVPVTYLYDGEYIYVHSAEGMKLRAMRENPMVCLEVEQMHGMSNWRTVVVRGHFEQLGREDEERAMGLIATRLSKLDTDASARLTYQEDIYRREGFDRPVLFRIRLEDRTGRFELS